MAEQQQYQQDWSKDRNFNNRNNQGKNNHISRNRNRESCRDRHTVERERHSNKTGNNRYILINNNNCYKSLFYFNNIFYFCNRFQEESFEPMSRGRSNSRRYSRSQSAIRDVSNKDLHTEMKTLPASYRHRLRPQGKHSRYI